MSYPLSIERDYNNWVANRATGFEPAFSTCNVDALPVRLSSEHKMHTYQIDTYASLFKEVFHIHKIVKQKHTVSNDPSLIIRHYHITTD